MANGTNRAEWIRRALEMLAEEPQEGALAFTRALDREAIQTLLSLGQTLGGWRLVGVGDAKTNGWITADQAVDLREGKGPATILLVDRGWSGAGMDGVYSAAREIGESKLLSAAVQVALGSLEPGLKNFAKEALRRAARVGGRRRTVSDREKLEFLGALAGNPQCPGAALPHLQLWPVVGDFEQARALLEFSGAMVERLLLPPSTAQTVEGRIASLQLQDATERTRTSLADALRQGAAEPAKETLLRRVARNDDLWLGNLRPLFLEKRVQRIEIVPWRKNGKLSKWSGLVEVDGGHPEFRVDPSKPKNRLEVRWTVQPDGLPRGCASFHVRVLAGEEELAAQTVSLNGRKEQKASFGPEDFSGLDEAGRWQAQIDISVVGSPDVPSETSSDFTVCFGEAPDRERVSAGKSHRCAVEGALDFDRREQAEDLAKAAIAGEQGQPDKNGFLSFHQRDEKGEKTKAFRVERPPLLAKIEEDWSKREESPIGRWVVWARPDGSIVQGPDYEPVPTDGLGERGQKLTDAVQTLRKRLSGTGGILSRIYVHNGPGSSVIGDYLNAWVDALESGPPELALANTVEVKSPAGATIGLIVLPFHPVRVAWQAAFDTLAIDLRWGMNLKPGAARRALEILDGAHFPFLLPGLKAGEAFVFGDCIGLAGVAMVCSDDPEPKASLSMLAATFAGDSSKLRPEITIESGEALARVLRAYLDTHPGSSQLLMHALRPGDGATVVRALGRALMAEAEEDQEGDSNGERKVAVRLNLYPARQDSLVTGRHLTKVVQRRRSGVPTPHEEDAWCLEAVDFGGGRMLPRLRWAKREERAPEGPGHLSIAFDCFSSSVACEAQPDEEAPMLAYGLIANVQRQFAIEGERPFWRTMVPAKWDGPKFSDRVVTDRLLRAQTAVLKAVARHLGCEGKWPVLKTLLSSENRQLLDALHERSDWVVTMDRNIGVEYFDSPKQLPDVFDAYVIDAVPERDDLGCLQLITSTSHFDEVRGLLDATLAQMGLSSSERNCKFLLDHLKALSGHLALRLAGAAVQEDGGSVGPEMVALAAAYARSLRPPRDAEEWPDLSRGFFVPLDDVRDLLEAGEDDRREGEEGRREGKSRADLLYVGLGSRDRLVFRFVEVKYRRHLRTVRSGELASRIAEQLDASRSDWEERYASPKCCSEPERVLRVARLARVLRFYADKAFRHHLAQDVYTKLATGIDKLVKKPSEWKSEEKGTDDIGLVFCPEHRDSAIETLEGPKGHPILIFGPDCLPDRVEAEPPTDEEDGAPARPPRDEPDAPSEGGDGEVSAGGAANPGSVGSSESGTDVAPKVDPVSPAERAEAAVGPVSVLLGTTDSGQNVSWTVAIDGNPHLLIVGQPGMGKTTALVNICRQLWRAGVAPIVFSYHSDLDGALGKQLDGCTTHDCYSLGFNPLRIPILHAHAHVDSAGQIRDIFAAIFKDLGEVQLAALREAVLETYTRLGWGDGADHPVPRFSAFLELLESSKKNGGRDQGTERLLLRLRELRDYQFFDDCEDSAASLLAGGVPRLIRIHTVQSDLMQRAYASFMLYRVYQEMFVRGPQPRITHAVVFDESHRASKLQLLPRMAKECRKFGLSLIVASQEARDFEDSLFSAVSNYMVLRVVDADAKAMAKKLTTSDRERTLVDTLMNLEKHRAVLRTGDSARPRTVRLLSPSEWGG